MDARVEPAHDDWNHSAACAYSVTGGHEHTRLRSPWTLSTRPTGHQYLSVREELAGNQPSARE